MNSNLGDRKPESSDCPLPVAHFPIDEKMYRHISHLASKLIAKSQGRSTLNPSELVHEGWIRLAKYKCQDLDHVSALLLLTMPRVLIDEWRRARTAKHGGLYGHVPFDEFLHCTQSHAGVAVDWEDYKGQIQFKDGRQSQVVEWHFWDGLNTSQIARRLSLSERTIKRDLSKALKTIGAALAEDQPAIKGRQHKGACFRAGRPEPKSSRRKTNRYMLDNRPGPDPQP